MRTSADTMKRDDAFIGLTNLSLADGRIVRKKNLVRAVGEMECGGREFF